MTVSEIPSNRESPYRVFPSVSAEAESQGEKPSYVGTLLASTGLVFSLACALGVPVTEWIQPSCIGLLWGICFLAGLVVGGAGRCQPQTALYACAIGITCFSALRRLTDLGHGECLLIVSGVLVAGWLTAMVDRNRLPIRTTDGRIPKLAIWDIAFLTCMVACVCRAIQMKPTDVAFFLGVAACSVAGIYLSWLASRWTWNDCYSRHSFAFWSLPGCIVLAGVFWFAPSTLTVWQTTHWLLTGPINVVATQATVVLAVLTVLRHSHLESGPRSLATSAVH